MLTLPKVIYIPEREIVKLGKERWIIYLPKSHNDLWEEIKKQGLRVKVYVQITVPDRTKTSTN